MSRSRPPIADLHCHFPMHVMAGEGDRPLKRLNLTDTAVAEMNRALPRPGLGDKLRSAVLWIASHLKNYRKFGAKPRADLEALEQGNVRLVLSVLYSPFDELDIGDPFGEKPEAGYWKRLLEDLETVEQRLEAHPGRATVVRDAAGLDSALAGDSLAFVHCVEGGFHLGGETSKIDEHVAELARLGVFYVTLAHLFWRQVATNANALPFLPDKLYERLFPQPANEGLADLGVAAVEAMHRHHVAVDVSHMRADALDETFELMAELDRRNGGDPATSPAIASHAAFRFGAQNYNVDEATVRRIADRGGVVGLILAQHQLQDNLSQATTREESLAILCKHIDKIVEVTGDFDHVALGTDFDGFIKPTMAGLEGAGDLPELRGGLVERYGEANADAFLFDNAYRVVRTVLAARG